MEAQCKDGVRDDGVTSLIVAAGAATIIPRGETNETPDPVLQ